MQRTYLVPSETMPRDELLDLQMRKLRYQLGYAMRNSPFYASLLEGIDLESLRARSDVASLPTIDKEMLVEDQKQAPPYGTRCCVPPDKVAHVYLTGGTSGLGQEVYS